MRTHLVRNDYSTFCGKDLLEVFKAKKLANSQEPEKATCQTCRKRAAAFHKFLDGLRAQGRLRDAVIVMTGGANAD